MLSKCIVSEPIFRDIRKSIARLLVCWSNLDKRTLTKERRATIQARTGHPEAPHFQLVSLVGLSGAQCSFTIHKSQTRGCPYSKFGNSNLLPSCMERWGLSITKEINSIKCHLLFITWKSTSFKLTALFSKSLSSKILYAQVQVEIDFLDENGRVKILEIHTAKIKEHKLDWFSCKNQELHWCWDQRTGVSGPVYRNEPFYSAENQFWNWPWSHWKDCHQTRGILPCSRIWYQTGIFTCTWQSWRICG